MFGDSKNKKIILGSLLVLLSPQFLAKKAFAFEGIAQLKKEIQFGEYIPRTCVASLLAEKDVNEKIHKAALEVLESYGYPKETLSHLIDFKSNGPVGLEECLVGPYEDVTIITHGMSDGLGNTLLTYQEEKDGQIQSFKLLPQLFRNFLKPKEEGTGLMRLGLSLKQITLIGCGGSVYAEHAKVLRRLARENNLVINLQPEDWLISSILKKEGVVTESLIPPMIAENAQPEFVREVFCLIGFKESLFSKEMEKQNCLRGRYTVSLGGVTLGFSSSRRVVLFRQVFQNYSGHLGDSAQYNGPGMDLSFIGSLNPNFGTKAWLRSSTSYGLSVSIFESLEVRRNVELESPGRSLKNAHDAKEYLILDKMRSQKRKLESPVHLQSLVQILLEDRDRRFRQAALEYLYDCFRQDDAYFELNPDWLIEFFESEDNSYFKRQAALFYLNLRWMDLEENLVGELFETLALHCNLDLKSKSCLNFSFLIEVLLEMILKNQEQKRLSDQSLIKILKDVNDLNSNQAQYLNQNQRLKILLLGFQRVSDQIKLSDFVKYLELGESLGEVFDYKLIGRISKKDLMSSELEKLVKFLESKNTSSIAFYTLKELAPLTQIELKSIYESLRKNSQTQKITRQRDLALYQLEYLISGKGKL